MERIMSGTAALTMCCVSYLIWWIMDFRPDGKSMTSWPWLMLTMLLAFIGVWLSIAGIGEVEKSSLRFGIWPVGIGIAAYLVLMAGSGAILHRQVTAELLLIVGWTVLQICVLDAAGAMTGELTWTNLFMVFAMLVAAVSFLAYLAYYNLSPVMGYIDGMVPLLLCGGLMLTETVVMGCGWNVR